jgi:hypothetical protein
MGGLRHKSAIRTSYVIHSNQFCSKADCASFNFKEGAMLTEGVERGHSAHRQAARTAAIVPRLMSANGSCVDGAHGSRDFLVVSLRSGASHVYGLFVRR